MKCWFPLFIGLLLAGGVSAKQPPSGGHRLEFEQPFESWRLYGSAVDSATRSEVKVSQSAFRHALQIEINKRIQREHELMFGGKTTERIRKGDVLLLSFHVCCPESADESALGRFHLSGQIKKSPRPAPLFNKTITAGKKWKRILIPFEAPADSEKNCSITFRLGGTKPQTLQFAKFEVINYRNRQKAEKLPSTETGYVGMEPDAPWRKAAAARIEKYRKADLVVEVADKNGRPLPGAKVHVELKRHAFGFGAAISLNAMFGDRNPEDAAKYRAAVEDLFNKVVFENRMKWKFFKDGDPQIDMALAWCAERKMPVRGHCMVWPAWQRLPRDMEREFAGRPDEFRRAIGEHVHKMATIYPDGFAEWDIVNELFSQHEFVDLLGKPVVADWFHIAKESNPNFTCYINDYAILAGYDQAHQDNYHEWIEYLLEQGAPVGGIGLQGHFRAPIPPEEILRRLDRFAEFGLEMQITEYDFDETDEMLQARFTRDFMTAVFSHPQVVGIMTWCLWEKAAWKATPAFFSKDWKKKRIAQAWEYMVEKEWHTEKTLAMGEDGTAQLRGFLGEYEITVKTRAGRRKTVPFSLGKEGGVCHVRFD